MAAIRLAFVWLALPSVSFHTADFVNAQSDVIYSHGTVHDNCTTLRYNEEPSVPVILECAGDFQIPSKHVRLNEIPTTIEGIFLGTKLKASVPPEKYTEKNSIMLSDTTSILPDLPHLVTVGLMQFNNDKAVPRLPFTRFLENVHKKLKYLYIHNSKLVFLTSADFRGFASLLHLEVKRCQINSLSVGVFKELQYPTFIFNQLGHSTLERFSASGNTMSAVDWRMFEPVSSSIRTIELDSNPKLATINMTSGSPFKLPGLRMLNLTGSDQLKSLPKDVLLTVKDSEELYAVPSVVTDQVADSDDTDNTGENE
ncbi:uncharacterized protein LOC129601398 [Paramacrobiotus metropolitanus]|uniref:uncharacterized protein LOC129601398 n=1 Tax=Paramacrobiotus metropolitanus TaxID=2943436 RepID=UPI002445FF56|nr:uncharacterized protein LOC129601398 [Paramacrobiotus metropolitanus]